MKIIAEIGQAHEGSEAEAMCYIDAMAHAGVWAVKFQHHLPRYDPVQDFRGGVELLRPEVTRREYWERTLFQPLQWRYLRDYAAKLGLAFGMAVSVPESITNLSGLTPDFWKLPHHVVRNDQLRAVMHRQSGMMIASAHPDVVPEADVNLFCTQAYPASMGELPASLEQYNGLSSHIPDVAAGLWAAMQGAEYFECHVIRVCQYSRCPDAESSLEFAEVRELVRLCKELGCDG